SLTVARHPHPTSFPYTTLCRSVADRHDPPFGQDDGGVAPGGVELGLDRGPGVPERVPGGAEDLGDAAEGERVLQVPGAARLVERAAFEQRTEAADRRDGARVRPDLGDHGMENAEVARERLEVEGGG